MSADTNKKTLRHFYCRDSLWQCFERMSEDFDRGIDDLVNEGMRFFAREKGYLPTENENRPGGVQHSPPPQRNSPRPPPPLPGPRVTAPRAATPPPPPSSASRAMPVEPEAPPLFVIFDNKKYLVDKDQFIIGRGSKSSDLPIKDGNISRKHAAVVRRNGGYYIKDLGSTNGIDFNGQRVDNKRIEEGDTYFLCDYPVRFTYR